MFSKLNVQMLIVNQAARTTIQMRTNVKKLIISHKIMTVMMIIRKLFKFDVAQPLL